MQGREGETDTMKIRGFSHRWPWPTTRARAGGKTPVEIAHTPSLDRLAQAAQFGTFVTLPESVPDLVDVANMFRAGLGPGQRVHRPRGN